MLSTGTVQICFGLGVAATALVAWLARRGSVGSGAASVGSDRQFTTFQRTYLIVYLMAMMADWLQGPFVYALYEAYGFSKEDNATLFVCGFGSSFLFGTVIGAMADRFGRRKFAVLYCLLYIASCTTKHFNNFSVLMLGRVTGGIATSLLFSVFDSWLVSEHNKRSFDAELLGGIFSLAIFGNSVVAITAGEVGQAVADFMPLTPLSPGGDVFYGGYCTPFDVSILLLVVCTFLLMIMWPENYGQKATGGEGPGIQAALQLVLNEPKILLLGLVCSFFEASMFIFVFQWTPAVTEVGAPKPPYGHIFATFMVMCMLGSRIFSLAAQQESVESIGRSTLLIAAVCHAIPVVTDDPLSNFIAFLVFELCVGMYFPMMGTLKSTIVPEETRAAIYNIYRVPLNAIVLIALVLKIETKTAFMLTTGLLVTAALLQTRIVALQKRGNSQYQPVSSQANDIEFGLDDAECIGASGMEFPSESEMPSVL